MGAQIHGGNIWSHGDKGILDFSASLNPLGMPPEVMEAAVRGISASVHYPDPACADLRRAISRTHGVPEEWIVCGNGAAELLDRIAAALRPRRALICAPAFGEYERSLAVFNCKVVRHYLKPEQQFDLTEGFLRFLRPNLNLVVLCNPNNPTGRAIPSRLLLAAAERCARLNITLLVDESFLELTDPDRRTNLVPLLSQYPNLILLHSLTKSYCIPGLRLGYLMTGSRALLEKLASCAQPWAVSVPAQFAGVAAMSRPDWPELGRQAVAPQRERLTAALGDFGCTVWNSHANYLLFRVPGCSDLQHRMLKKGILIRCCSGFAGLNEEYYRVAVRTEEENTAFLTALSHCLRGGR